MNQPDVQKNESTSFENLKKEQEKIVQEKIKEIIPEGGEIKEKVEKARPEIAEEKKKAEEAKEIPKPAPLPPKKPQPAVLPKDELTVEIEKILEEDLSDIYFSLPPKVQKKFHDEGDRVVQKIHRMIISLKVKAQKVLRLIRNWLKIIPGINKFFLEQEAKIKTDKIMLLAKYEKEKRMK